MTASTRVRASLFVSCLVDQLYPQVGVATVQLLRRLGVEVDFPRAQTCCGQPVFNSGFAREARELARRMLDIFEGSQYVVVPSGSCGSMVKVFYPELLRDAPDLHARARALAARTYELSHFLVRVLGVTEVGARYHGKVTYHPSCHLLRELGVAEEPRILLRHVQGIELVELPPALAQQCCGFGGTFSVKYPGISEGMLRDKLRGIEGTGADTLVSCDMGCLMHLGGALHRRGSAVRTMHLAELLAREE